MRFLVLGAAVLVASCGPATRATPRAIDPSALYVAQVGWSPSEITAMGVSPAFPRNQWVALVSSNGFLRHARVGGRSRAECDDCVGPRVSLLITIPEPATDVFAIGPATQRLPTIRLVSETPFDSSTNDDAWVSTSAFDVNDDGQADLERVERCDSSIASGCESHVCTRVCTATRNAGSTEVRGEICRSTYARATACVPTPPVIESTAGASSAATASDTSRTAPTTTTVPTATVPTETVTPAGRPPTETPTAAPTHERRRHWGSRRRPR